MVTKPLLKKWNLADWIKDAASQVPEYFYVMCSDPNCSKPELVDYFRLYRKTPEGPILIAQGDNFPDWEEKYNAKFIEDKALKPYPHLD